MKREIRFALMYRDMWQSSGKFMPTAEQLISIADPIIDMSCFDRVETNGGGFEQINLLLGENPNKSVRQWTAPFNKAGIQTQMLERGLNGIRMNPVSSDLRKLMFSVKKKQGTNISRSFDGLNNPQNLNLSFQFASEAGMIPQAALCITYSPIHTVKYFIKLAEVYIDLGAKEICIKDMAGIGRPSSIGKIVKGIRKRHPNILIQYHGHSTPGFSVASSLEAARNGANIIDVGMEPLSWGTGHADVITIKAMLKDDGFLVKDIDLDAYMEVRKLSQKFIDEFLGYYINPRNRYMNSLLLNSGLPGGMMGSLMADLESNLKSLNKWLTKKNRKKLSQDDLLTKLFREVQFIWPKLGYPPLVTPFSQYVKNTALLNVVQMEKGKQRWSLLDENTWGMILGKSGKLPGPLDREILELAKKQDRKFFKGNPQELYPNVLPEFSAKMDENGWDYGEDNEELMEYAMHPQQYEDYRSGRAKQRFQSDLEERKNKIRSKGVDYLSDHKKLRDPSRLTVEIQGIEYQVDIKWKQGGNTGNLPDLVEGTTNGKVDENFSDIISAPLEGKFYLTKDSNEMPVKVGDHISKGDTVAYIESMKVINAITSDKSGRIVDILVNHGDDIEEDDVIFKILS